MYIRTDLDTAVNQLQNSTADSRAQLAAKAADNGTGWNQLARMANHVAELEGQLAAVANARQHLHYLHTQDHKPEGTTPRTTLRQVAYKALLGLTRGADDEWSGRGNDAARSYHDGQRAAVEAICAWVDAQL